MILVTNTREGTNKRSHSSTPRQGKRFSKKRKHQQDNTKESSSPNNRTTRWYTLGFLQREEIKMTQNKLGLKSFNKIFLNIIIVFYKYFNILIQVAVAVKNIRFVLIVL
jgi:hypothetical protein